VSGEIIDLQPILRKKAQADCTHQFADVDNSAASLTCRSCGVELDPWWFLRRLANDEEGEWQRVEKQRTEYFTWLQHANEQIQRLNTEIQELTATKNRLWNEHVNGKPLGAQVRRRRS
jgi:DNA repair exonuclease SbcCD ATPase subunit